MPQTVDIPEIGEVDFPDDMSADDITSAIQTRILKQPEVAAPQADIPPLIPDNVSNAYGRAQMATRMVNPASDRNVLQIPSESERRAVKGVASIPSEALHLAIKPFSALGEVANAQLQDQLANVAENARAPSRGSLVRSILPIPGENIRALWNRTSPEERLPFQEGVESYTQDNPVTGTAAKFSSKAVEMAPMAAAAMPAGVLGKLISIGFTKDMIEGAGDAATKIGNELGKPPSERDINSLTDGISEMLLAAPGALMAGIHTAPKALKDIALTKGDARRVAIRDLAEQLKQEPALPNANLSIPENPIVQEDKPSEQEPPGVLLDQPAGLPIAEPINNKLPKPEVPETEAEYYESATDEIRRKKARTINQIKAIFPMSELTREQARTLRDAAWKDYVEPKTTPEEIPNAIPKRIPTPPDVVEISRNSEEVGARIPQPEEVAISQGGEGARTPNGETENPVTPAAPLAIIGMGGAIPAEFERSGGNETAMKYSRIDQERQQRGLEPLTKPDSVSDQVTLDKAISAIDRDPSLPEKLVKELLAKPRTIEDWENHVLLLRKIDLRDAYEKSAREAAQAYDDSKQFPNREDDMIRANLETARISDELQDLEQASRVSGSARGRALRSLQVMANEDYSLASLETSRRAAKGGALLTPDERAELTKVAEDYKKANDELQKHIDEKDKRLADAAIKEALDKVEREAKTGPQIHPKIIQIAEKIVAGLDKRADAARQRIKERGFRFNTGVDPTVLRDVAEIGAAHLGHKVLDFAKWSERMLSEFGEGIKPHLTEIFAASNKIIDEIKATPAVKRELKSPDVKSRIAATSENIQEKIKAGKKDDVSGQVNRLARWLIESKQVDSREGLIDAVHAVLKEADPSITRREAMDAISGYGDFKQLSKDEISTQLRGFKGEMQQISKLEDMAASKPPLKTGMERRTPTDDERALIKSVNEAKIKFQVPITDPSTQLKSALDTRKTQVENQTKDLERRLAEGDFTKKPRRELVIDRRLQELTAKRDAIRRKVRAAEAEARNKLKTPLEKTFDWVSNARRFAVLSGTKVLLKLAAYSATKLPTMAATEAMGGVLGKLPFIRQIAGRAPSEGGFNARAITNSAAKFFTKGIEDAYKTGIEGHSDIKSAFDTKPEMQRHWYDFAQSLHEVIKSPLRRAAFELSLAKRMEFAARKGTDITDPLVQMTLAKDAYMDSNRALLLENNRLASGIRGIFKQFEQKTKETGKPSLHGKAAATFGRVELPILSVPLNYVKQTMTAAFGLITGSSKLAVAFHRGIENLKPEEADAIMRHLKYGSIGGAMLLYGFYDGYHNGASGTLGGFYQPGQKRRKDQAQFGGLKIGEQKISSVLLHNPMIAVAQLGHTIGAIAASKVKKGSAEERGITVGALTGTLGLLNESPLGRQVELVSTTSDPRTAGEALDEHIKGIVIPQLVNEAAQFTDKPAQNLQDYFLMDTRQRKPHGLAQHLKTGVPILREQVPLKK